MNTETFRSAIIPEPRNESDSRVSIASSSAVAARSDSNHRKNAFPRNNLFVFGTGCRFGVEFSTAATECGPKGGRQCAEKSEERPYCARILSVSRRDCDHNDYPEEPADREEDKCNPTREFAPPFADMNVLSPLIAARIFNRSVGSSERQWTARIDYASFARVGQKRRA